MLAAACASAQEVVVVDNGSSDGTAELVEERSPEAKLIRLDDKPWVRANVGIEAAEADYLLLVNPEAWRWTQR